MEVAHPTAGWEQVGEKFYRKTQLYTQIFDQGLDLDNYIVAGAPYGGAIGTSTNHRPITISPQDRFQHADEMLTLSKPCTETMRS